MSYNFIDIRNITAGHFVGAPYPTFLAKKIEAAADIDINSIGKSDIKNDLGTSYFMDLYVTLPDGERIRLPHEPLVKFGFRKRIITSYPIGNKRQGSVKEFISAGDWNIDIQGVCMDAETPNRYPTEQVALINKIAGINESLEVDNPLLNLFGIYKMVITASNFSDMKGVPGAQAYVINAISDEDFFAEIGNNDLRGL